MEELIFFAVIIFFTIIESIARSRKAKQGGGDEPSLPDLPELERRVPTLPDVEVATYDEDASYDERAVASGSTRSTYERAQPAPRRASSETMLPGDLLEELAGLTGRLEKGRGRPIPTPRQSPPLPVPKRRPVPPVPRPPLSPNVRREALPERIPEPHRVHLSHAGYGTDPSERARSAQDVLNRPPEWHDPDAAAVHRQLRSRSGSALRQAIILQEVLGPPMALRDERFEDF